MTDYSELKERLESLSDDFGAVSLGPTPSAADAMRDALAAIEALERREAEARRLLEAFVPLTEEESPIRRWLEGGAS